MGGLTNESLLAQIPRLVWQLPVDLVATGCFSVFAAFVYSTPSLTSSVALPIIGLPLLLFVPGYVVVAIAFPSAPHVTSRPLSPLGGIVRGRRGIDFVERLALSFGISVAVVPLAMVFWWPLGLTPDTAPLALAGIGFAGSILGTVLRLRVPSSERFIVPYRRWFRDLYSGLFRSGPVGVIINIALLLSVVFAATMIGYAFVVPNDSESYSTLYLGTENESGELVMADYLHEFTRGEPEELVVGVTNDETHQTDYTLVVELQRVQISEGSITVLERQELERFQLTLDNGETWERPHTITPQMTGDDLRVQYNLYKGRAPPKNSPEAAYRTVFVWINVSEAQA